MLFVGDDWAEDHHDVEVQDESGHRLATARVPEGVAGISRLHELIGRFAGPDLSADQVQVGIENRPRAVGGRAGRRRLHGLRG